MNKEVQKVRVTKEFSFDMAHALLGYDGKCSNIHGHTYHLDITLIGPVMDQPAHPKNGMVIDFADLKSIVREHIIDVYDHSLVLNDAAPYTANLDNLSQRIILVPFQPTCENLLLDIVRVLKNSLPEAVSLFAVKLRETPTSYAEWHQCDNEL